MSDIGKGDWVQCVDTRGMDHIVKHLGVYRVEALDEVHNIPCLILEGVTHPDGWRRVRADCFRPIWRRDLSLIETLMQPLPDTVEAV